MVWPWGVTPHAARFRGDNGDNRASPTVEVGKAPIEECAARCYLVTMNTLLMIVVLLILFGGGGFYFGGPAIGGGGLGLILLIVLIVYLMGGLRGKN